MSHNPHGYSVPPFDDEPNHADTSALVGDRSGNAELVQGLHVDFHLRTEICEELVDWFRERGMGGSRANMSESLMKVGLVKILEYMFKHPMLADLYAMLYVLDDPLMDDIVGHKCPSEFAKSIGVTKARINKAVMQAQQFFKLQPRAGQRKAEGRQAMTAARMKQLNK